MSAIYHGHKHDQAMQNSDNLTIRAARQTDLAGLVALYNEYILNTPITFDLEPHSVDQRQDWFKHYKPSGPHRLLVAIKDHQLVGFASSSQFNPKAAYGSSVEVSIYLLASAQGQGIGRQLYQALFDQLQEENVHRAYALITQPNLASNALHESFGFQRIGTLNEVGRKFGRYWDVSWYEKRLQQR